MDKLPTRKALALLFLWAVLITLVWFVSFGFVNKAYAVTRKEDLPGLLFGAASFALFILSIFLAFLAVVGWQTLQDNLRKAAEEAARKLSEPLEKDLRDHIKRLEDELQGRVFSILGWVMGEISIDLDAFKSKNKHRLGEALQNCKKGYEILQKVGGAAEYMALNNLVFYSCLMEDQSLARYILEKARLLREKGQEHGNRNLLLTYARAVFEFGSDPDEITEARKIVESVVRNPTSEQERRDAENCLGLLNTNQEPPPAENHPPAGPT